MFSSPMDKDHPGGIIGQSTLLLLPQREEASWAQLLTNRLLSFYLSSLLPLMLLPQSIYPLSISELLIMRHWALEHVKNQVAGQGPGGPGQQNEAFALNKSSNALCQGSVGVQGHGATQPIAAQGRRLAGANRSRKGPCSGTRAHHQSLI